MGESLVAAHSRIFTRVPLALLTAYLGCVQHVTQESAVPAVNPILAQGVNVTGSITLDNDSPDLVRARAVVANNGDHPVRLSVGSCPLIVRAYTRPEVSGAPTWTSLDTPRGCKAFRHPIALAPGESQSLDETFLVRTKSGDRLKEGLYTFTLSVRFLDPEFTTPEYPAGQVFLTR
jgi:hypothetical protein